MSLDIIAWRVTSSNFPPAYFESRDEADITANSPGVFDAEVTPLIATVVPSTCDCELGHNGCGVTGRECDCPAGRPAADFLMARNAELEACAGFLPAEPTDAMLDAAHEVPIESIEGESVCFTSNREARAIWQAMLAVALGGTKDA